MPKLWQIFPSVSIYLAEMTDVELLREYVTKRSDFPFLAKKVGKGVFEG